MCMYIFIFVSGFFWGLWSLIVLCASCGNEIGIHAERRKKESLCAWTAGVCRQPLLKLHFLIRCSNNYCILEHTAVLTVEKHGNDSRHWRQDSEKQCIQGTVQVCEVLLISLGARVFLGRRHHVMCVIQKQGMLCTRCLLCILIT